jgi:hypothetical protein
MYIGCANGLIGVIRAQKASRLGCTPIQIDWTFLLVGDSSSSVGSKLAGDLSYRAEL